MVALCPVSQALGTLQGAMLALVTQASGKEGDPDVDASNKPNTKDGAGGAERLETARQKLNMLSVGVGQAIEKALGPMGERMQDDDEQWARTHYDIQNAIASIFPSAMSTVREYADGSEENTRKQLANQKRFWKLKFETLRQAGGSTVKNLTAVAGEEHRRDIKAKIGAVKEDLGKQLEEAIEKVAQLSSELESANVKIKFTEEALMSTQKLAVRNDDRAVKAEAIALAATTELKNCQDALSNAVANDQSERLSEQLTQAIAAFDELTLRTDREIAALAQDVQDKQAVIDQLKRENQKRISFTTAIVAQLTGLKRRLKGSEDARKDLEEIIANVKQQMRDDMRAAGIHTEEDVQRRIEEEQRVAKRKGQEMDAG